MIFVDGGGLVADKLGGWGVEGVVGILVEQIVPHRLDVGMVLGI